MSMDRLLPPSLQPPSVRLRQLMQLRSAPKRWRLSVLCGYTVVCLAVFGWFALQTEGAQSQMAKLSTVTSAQAATK